MYNNENTNFIYDNIKQNIYKNTLWIVLIIIVVILSIIFFSMKSSNNSYIILDNNKIIEYNNEKYQYVDNDDYIKSNYKVFYQNKYIGSYFIDEVDSFTGEVFFTNKSSSNRYLFDKPLLAISNNIDFIEFKNEEFTMDDLEIFNNISNKDYITALSEITSTSKVTLDFDSDGVYETFYTVTYDSLEDLTNYELLNNNSYSVFYYTKNGQSYLIKENELYQEGENIIFSNYKISSIIDINNDDIYEIIIINMMYETPIYEIYEFKRNSYELAFSTTIGGNYE